MSNTRSILVRFSAKKKRFFSSPKRPEQLCVPPSLLFIGYWDIFFSGERQPVCEGKTSFPLTMIEQIVINQQFPNVIKKTSSVEQFLKRECSFCYLIRFYSFMESFVSLPWSQKPATGPYLQPE
jgi:hypothetical protein